MILLAEAPEDLPAIQGMLSAVGLGNLRDGALQRAAIDITQLSATNPEKSVNEIVVAAELINKQIEAVQTYIGEEQNIQYYTKVSGFIENGNAVVTERLADDGAGGYCTMAAVLPEAPEVIFDNYELSVWPAVEVKMIQAENVSPMTVSSRSYDVLAARDDARKWVYGFGNKSGEPASKLCSVCGKSSANCGGYSVHDYYNTGNYSVYDHNDRANFASQALKAGGLPTDDIWKKDSTTWIRARSLEKYLLDNGYLIDDGYSMAAAGGLIFCKNSAGGNAYHVEVIVANDTVTRQFCAHTHDRYNTSIANNANWKYDRKNEGTGLVIVKKIIMVALCLINILVFTSCKGNYNIESGVYVADTGNLSRIEFDTTEQSFVFMHTGYLSTLIEGTYECEDEKIFAKSEEGVYVFKIVDNDSISFIKGESSETPIEDGTIFKLA